MEFYQFRDKVERTVCDNASGGITIEFQLNAWSEEYKTTFTEWNDRRYETMADLEHKAYRAFLQNGQEQS